MLATRFTELVGCRMPIQQAGMGGTAGPELAVAVAEAGGLGMLGGVMLPAPLLVQILDGVRQQTTGAIGVNFLMPFLDRDCVVVAASRCRVIEFFYGDPDAALVQLVHQGGALACWQVGSLEEAQAAVAAGCDLIVAQGTEAGGHVRGRIGLLPLLGQVLAMVDVPVLAAGGIGTGRALAAVLAAGAAGARVGTRFVAAAEANAHPAYVDALIAARPEDTVLTETFSAGWSNAPHRVLRSSAAAAESFQGDIVAEMSMGGQTMPVPRFAPPAPSKETTGTVQAMALYAGESVGAVQRIEPAASIVQEFTAEAERCLQHWTRTSVTTA
jgi:nitronate monooxygenase